MGTFGTIPGRLDFFLGGGGILTWGRFDVHAQIEERTGSTPLWGVSFHHIRI